LQKLLISRSKQRLKDDKFTRDLYWEGWELGFHENEISKTFLMETKNSVPSRLH
jgi:hypothetical protein